MTADHEQTAAPGPGETAGCGSRSNSGRVCARHGRYRGGDLCGDGAGTTWATPPADDPRAGQTGAEQGVYETTFVAKTAGRFTTPLGGSTPGSRPDLDRLPPGAIPATQLHRTTSTPTVVEDEDGRVRISWPGGRTPQSLVASDVLDGLVLRLNALRHVDRRRTAAEQNVERLTAALRKLITASTDAAAGTPAAEDAVDDALTAARAVLNEVAR